MVFIRFWSIFYANKLFNITVSDLIDLGANLPKSEEYTNLLVPVAVSSSHIAFGPIKMEPVFMIAGQSAGTVSAMSLEKSIPIYELNYNDIRLILMKDGQILELDME